MRETDTSCVADLGVSHFVRADGRPRPSEQTPRGRALRRVAKARTIARRKAEVLALLAGPEGPKCSLCGRKDRLEPDHIYGRTWSPRKIAAGTRWRKYLEDARAGLLRLLCRSCNAKYRPAPQDQALQEREAREREDAVVFTELRTGAPVISDAVPTTDDEPW